MRLLDRDTFDEKAAHLDRHLARVEAMLPERAEDFAPETPASDAVILHLWQAVQIALDVATSAAMRLGTLGSPATYADAFRALRGAGLVDAALSDRLVQAVGFRTAVAHAYHDLDMERVWATAKDGPADLRAFFVALRPHTS